MAGNLLTAQQVQQLLHVDTSTIYRMASDGRLPGVRVGRQWRFRAGDIDRLLHTARTAATPPVTDIPAALAAAVLDLVAEPLGVMMVVTDLGGRPVTPVVNPCPWFAARAEDPDTVEACAAEWRVFAAEPNLAPQLREGGLGFLCAHALVRSGHQLVGMVLAGGIAPDGGAAAGLYDLDAGRQRRVLDTLPRVAALLSRLTELRSDAGPVAG